MQCRWRYTPKSRHLPSWLTALAWTIRGAGEVAAELGWLPLGLAQAAAVVAAQKLGMAFTWGG